MLAQDESTLVGIPPELMFAGGSPQNFPVQQRKLSVTRLIQHEP